MQKTLEVFPDVTYEITKALLTKFTNELTFLNF